MNITLIKLFNCKEQLDSGEYFHPPNPPLARGEEEPSYRPGVNVKTRIVV